MDLVSARALSAEFSTGSARRSLSEIVSPDPDTTVIISLAGHTKRANPHAVLAELFPGLAATGRRRSDKPPCCDDAAMSPRLGEELQASLPQLFRL